MFFGIVNAPKTFAYYDDDNATPHQREISKDEWNKIVKSRNYYYKDLREITEEDVQKIRNRQKKLNKIVDKLSDNSSSTQQYSRSIFDTKTISFGLLTVVLGALIVFLIVKWNSFFRKKSLKIEEPTSKKEIWEIFQREDIRVLFETALQNGNQLEAVRLSYIWILQLMDKNQVLEFNEKKTNSDYRFELTNSQFLPSFREIGRVFEYVVYGEYKLNSVELDQYIKLVYETRDRLS